MEINDHVFCLHNFVQHVQSFYNGIHACSYPHHGRRAPHKTRSGEMVTTEATPTLSVRWRYRRVSLYHWTRYDT